LMSIPVSMRKMDDWSLGNQATTVWSFLPLTVSSPVGLLHAVKKDMTRMKQSHDALLSYKWLQFFGSTSLMDHPGIVSNFRWYTSKAHAVVTNVPGPANQISIGGVPIDSYVAVIPQPGAGGLAVAIFSYNNKVSVSVVSDAGRDPQEIVGFIEQYFNKLLDIASPNKKSE